MFELIPFDRRNHRVSVYDPFRAFDEMERAFFGSQQPAVLSFRTDVTDTGDSYKLEAAKAECAERAAEGYVCPIEPDAVPLAL